MKKFLRTVWQAGYPILIEVSVNLLITGIAVLIFASMFYKSTGLMGVNIAAELLESNIMLLTGVVSFVLIPLFMYFIRSDAKKHGEDSDAPVEIKTVLMCVLAACGAALAGAFMMSMLGLSGSNDNFAQYVEIFDDTAPVAVVLVTIIMTPLFEELLFRGLVFKRICRAYGAVAAALVSALIYAVTFGNLSQGIFGFIMGLVYAYAYTKTDKIWVPVVMHMAASTFVILLNALVENTNMAIAGSEAIAGVIGVIAGAAAAVSSVMYLQKFGKDVLVKETETEKDV